ncbi:MAG: hypothetical protein WCX79_03835 [Candidatus Paceibacterota bacterium]|jgi:TRAP-type C4-dicarboxylate transport system permease small subunit
MEPELKEKIEESLRLAEENNKMIRKMRRTLEWSRIMRIIYWLFIIAMALGAYYYIQPYVEQIKGVYGDAKDNMEGFGSFFDIFSIK